MEYFRKHFNIKEDKAYLKERLNDPKIFRQAQELCRYEFSFLRPWDMEPCSVVYENKELNWNLVANGDEEWTFMLNRFDYLQSLVLTYEINNDVECRNTAIDLINSWIDNHETVEYSLATRTLDTAIRIHAWVHALQRLSSVEPIEESFIDKVYISIMKQIEYMYQEYITKYTLSNWGSIQTSVILKLFPILDVDYENHEIYQWALEEFQTQVDIQIYDDGLLWEQSTMYHVEVLKHFLKVYKVLPTLKLKNVLVKMTKGLIALADSSFIIEAFGDSDRSSIVDVVSFVATELKDEQLKLYDDLIVDAERLYEMSYQEVIQYESMVAHFQEARFFDGFDSGIHSVRSDWSNQAHYWLYSNGSLGSGHGHSDNQHLSFFGNGKPLLIDSGRYTYREDMELRTALKGPLHHNSVSFKQQLMSVPNGSWSYDQFVNVSKNFASHKGFYHYLEGEINCDSIQHTRRILLSDFGVSMIVDDLYSEKHDQVLLHFNIDADVEVSSSGNEVMLNDFVLSQKDGMELEIINSHQSKKYNEIEVNQRLVFSSDIHERKRIATLIYPKDTVVKEVSITQGDDILLSSHVGRAFKINDDYTFVIISEEIYKGTKILKCEGHYFHAKSVVIDHKTNTVHVMRT